MQVTPLARPVNRGVFGARPVPSSVPFSIPASGAPDADRWAAPQPVTPMPNYSGERIITGESQERCEVIGNDRHGRVAHKAALKAHAESFSGER